MSPNLNKGYTRQLSPLDEEQFIQLLRLVYGETYSYQILYEPGGFSSLLNNKELISFGEFDHQHRLLAHTGFWHKEKNSDYIESGCSFRLAAGSIEFKAKTLPLSWQNCLDKLAFDYAFIHQQCTMSHSLAQRYASQFMKANPCGVILDYAQNEQIRGVAFEKNRMHALMMTTVLKTHGLAKKTIYISGFFQSWISTIYQNLNLPRTVIGIEFNTNTNQAFTLLEIQNNQSISLQRRLVLPCMDAKCVKPSVAFSSMRTDLIHLPMESFSLVNTVFPILLELGYMPCGIRPHVNQSDELILHYLEGRQDMVESLMNEIKIADKNTMGWIELWQRKILQIM